MMVYLMTDVLLFADEIFRKTLLKNDALDPANFYSSAGLSWSAMLKKTKVKLVLIF